MLKPRFYDVHGLYGPIADLDLFWKAYVNMDVHGLQGPMFHPT